MEKCHIWWYDWTRKKAQMEATMRLRNVKGSRETIAASEYVFVDEYEKLAGNWKEEFGNDHPIHIEVGMGKGRFIMDQAQAHPSVNYVGIEKYSSVLIRGLEKQEELLLKLGVFLKY